MLKKAFALHQKGQLAEAAPLYREVLRRDPKNADALHLLGVLETQSKNALAAIELFDRAIEIDPKNAPFFSNRGAALKDLRRLDEALESFNRAIAIQPDYAVALNNRGFVLQELKRPDEALASLNRALAIKPDYPEALYNRSLAQLLCGDYRNGLVGYEWRWQTNDFTSRPPNIAVPIWQDQALAGRRIVVFAEQGLGDIIQFARYLPLLIERGAKVTFLCPAKLRHLLQPVSREVEFVTSLDGAAPFDFQCALMSLPLRFGTDLRSIPGQSPYLSSEADRAATWKQRLGGEGFKIGIAWRGNPDAKIDRDRSVPLSEFAPLARRPGTRLISLQKNFGLDQLTNLPSGVVVETLSDGFDDGPDAFIDTVAVMSNLDLIVTIDTSVAHVAGALGRPTWVALQHVPDWRWLLDRTDSPWYPTMRLFRQQMRDDWSTVFRDIATELDIALSRRGA